MSQTVGMPSGPLDQLDAIAIWIREPGRPEVFGVIGRARGFRLHSTGGEVSDSVTHRLHLDDEVMEAA